MMKNKSKFRVKIPPVLVFLIGFFWVAHPAVATTDLQPATPKMKLLHTAMDNQQQNRIHLKNRILAQDSVFAERLRRDTRGGAEFKTAGIRLYVEDLKRSANKDIGAKDIPEMDSSLLLAQNSVDSDASRKKWKNLTPEQKEAFRKKYKKWKNLSPEKKAEIREKYQKFKNLNPEEQQKIRQNWKRYKNLSEEERQVLRKRHKQWRNLSDEDKQRLKTKMRRYRKMSPEQRQQLQKKRKKWQNLSPEEKRRIREQSKKKRRKGQSNSQQRKRRQ